MYTTSTQLSAVEKKATLSLASIYMLRFFGLFMLVPVLSLYAITLKHATPLLIGIALGCYGLTQAALQIPFGSFSDRYGRKRIIAFGLILFAIGSMIAALSPTIWGLILGRSLQGAGAIGSATAALLADLTRENQRTKAMAVIGITIGFSFSAAMILGPLLNNWFSVSLLFWFSFLFALFALFILKMWVPNPIQQIPAEENSITLWMILQNYPLLRLNIGILFLHAILTANFVVLPFILQKTMAFNQHQLWHTYLPALVLALFIIAPILRLTTSAKKTRPIYLMAITGLGLAELLLWKLQFSVIAFTLSLGLFFAAFTLIEAIIPSSVAKIAPLGYRGKAMGVNSTFQFLGIFIGGTVGGWLLEYFQMNGVLITCMLLAIVWFLIDIAPLRE